MAHAQAKLERLEQTISKEKISAKNVENIQNQIKDLEEEIESIKSSLVDVEVDVESSTNWIAGKEERSEEKRLFRKKLYYDVLKWVLITLFGGILGWIVSGINFKNIFEIVFGGG